LARQRSARRRNKAHPTVVEELIRLAWSGNPHAEATARAVAELRSYAAQGGFGVLANAVVAHYAVNDPGPVGVGQREQGLSGSGVSVRGGVPGETPGQRPVVRPID
jgi:hypothetical protein